MTDAASIPELESEVDRLTVALREAKQRLNDARSAAAGVAKGDIVLSVAGVEHKITRIRADWSGKPWVYGLRKLKNGSWGTSERCLYSDWRKP